jgi:hypothetical protein
LLILNLGGAPPPGGGRPAPQKETLYQEMVLGKAHYRPPEPFLSYIRKY